MTIGIKTTRKIESMKIHTQRKIDEIAGPIICRVIDFISYFLAKKTSTIKSDKVCIILLSEMGSLTLTFPMFQKLWNTINFDNLFILTFKKNVEIVQLLGLARNENIITIDDSSFIKFCHSSIKTLLTLRNKRIDTIIDCELFARVSSILSFFSGAIKRIGFYPYKQKGLYRGHHINYRVLYNPYIHISRQFVNLVDSMENSHNCPGNKNSIDQTSYTIPQVVIQDKDLKEFKKRLQKKFNKICDRPIIILNPGGGALPIRAWPVNYYQDLAKKFLDNKFSVVVTGLHEDTEAAQEIVQNCKNSHCVNLVGFTRTIYELLILFSMSKLLITNDGGPGHFSCLTKTPSIVFFGPETKTLYGSLNPNAIHLQADVACSPCLTAYNHRNSPCDGNNICLKEIHPEHVWEKSAKLLCDSQNH